MRMMSFLLAGLALVSMGLQFNDPDPVYWVAAYGATALVVGAMGLGKRSQLWTAITIGVVVGGMLWSVPGFGAYLLAGDYGSIFGSMRADRPYIEESREFLGLAMSLAALTWVYRRQP